MTKRLRIAREAEDDLDEAIAWYEREEPGLGQRFRAAVREALTTIAANPGLGSRVPHVTDDDARRWLVKRFPYAIVYYETQTEVRVVAVAHGHRRPGYWLRRT